MLFLNSYLPRLMADSRISIDLQSVVEHLPVLSAADDGRAAWLKASFSDAHLPRRLVIGEVSQ